MRFAGTLPQEIRPLIAGVNTEADWPSILRPKSTKVPDYRYDEHMKQHVPNIPLKPA